MNDGLLLADFLDYSEKFIIDTIVYGLIPFKTYQHQIDVITKLFKKKFIISKTDRQMGMTTLMLAFAHWYAGTFPNKTIFYTSSSQDMLSVCVKLFILLDYNVNKNFVYNPTEIVLDNKSKIFFKMADDCFFRGKRFDVILIDNAAWVDGISGWWPIVRTQLNQDGYLWINSTSEDKNNWFYQVYTNTKRANKICLFRKKYMLYKKFV